MSLGESSVRIVRSPEALERLIAAIECSREARPDWIHLQSGARLEQLAPTAWPDLLSGLHPVSYTHLTLPTKA